MGRTSKSAIWFSQVTIWDYLIFRWFLCTTSFPAQSVSSFLFFWVNWPVTEQTIWLFHVNDHLKIIAHPSFNSVFFSFLIKVSFFTFSIFSEGFFPVFFSFFVFELQTHRKKSEKGNDLFINKTWRKNPFWNSANVRTKISEYPVFFKNVTEKRLKTKIRIWSDSWVERILTSCLLGARTKC